MAIKLGETDPESAQHAAETKRKEKKTGRTAGSGYKDRENDCPQV